MRSGAILTAVTNGVDLEVLKAIQLRLAMAMDDVDTSPRDLAAISRQLTEVTAQIAALRSPVRRGGGARDELAARRTRTA